MNPAPLSPAARPPMKPLDLALGELLARAEPLSPAESVSRFDADGRVLAEDLVSSLNGPAHDNSSMDGYAVRCTDCADTAALLHVHQRIARGSGSPLLAHTPSRSVVPGQPGAPGAAAAWGLGWRVRVGLGLRWNRGREAAGGHVQGT